MADMAWKGEAARMSEGVAPERDIVDRASDLIAAVQHGQEPSYGQAAAKLSAAADEVLREAAGMIMAGTADQPRFGQLCNLVRDVNSLLNAVRREL
jgi:hypothetical protein